MHPLYTKATSMTEGAIAAAIEVHRHRGPGLKEEISEWCLKNEFEISATPAVNQKTVRIEYQGFIREEPLKFDVRLDQSLLIEAKSVENILPIHKAQLLTDMKLLNVPIGLLINFNVTRLVDGVSRLMLPGAEG